MEESGPDVCLYEDAHGLLTKTCPCLGLAIREPSHLLGEVLLVTNKLSCLIVLLRMMPIRDLGSNDYTNEYRSLNLAIRMGLFFIPDEVSRC